MTCRHSIGKTRVTYKAVHMGKGRDEGKEILSYHHRMFPRNIRRPIAMSS